MTPRPIVWSVAGSDSGGGAGIQADLRAFDAMAVHGCSAVAAITAQNSVAVTQIAPVDAALLDAQLAALASDMAPAAIKVGMLGNAANLQVLARWIDRLRTSQPGLPVVVDPVLRASTGAGFADTDLLQAYRDSLLPRATLLTPNRREAAILLGLADLEPTGAVEQAAQALQDMGCASVAITGGDSGTAQAVDHVRTPHASGWLRQPRLDTPHQHGTGCVFAASAAAALAHGFVSMDALVIAKMATTQALRDGHAAGQGAGPVHPDRDFAGAIANLPALGPSVAAPATPFAALTDTDLGLYAIVDSADWIRRVLDAGVRTVQLRIKDPQRPDLRRQIRDGVAAATAAGAQLFINDHWQLALLEGAYGVHLGQEDLATADLEALRHAGMRLGLSSHAYWEVCRAWAVQPSYIACGPIHPTRAKAMPWLPQGDANLAYWCQLLPLPVVAIAGMDAARATDAVRCGASGVAVISAITGSAEPVAAIDTLQRAIRVGRALPGLPAPRLPRPTLAPPG